MKVLITGSKGFVGKNLKLFLKVRPDITIFSFLKEDNTSLLYDYVNKVDFIFHLAGVNRSVDSKEFYYGNEILTQKLSDAVKKTTRKIPIIYTSSIHTELDTPYGTSKRNSENILLTLHRDFKIPVYIFRLPNIFGKWSKPNYNSVVSTFCHNITRDIPIYIKDPKDIVSLVYIDDVIKQFIKIMDKNEKNLDSKNFKFVNPTYEITVGDLAKQLNAFKEMRNSNILERVGNGLVKALYSTYISYLPQKSFSYPVKVHNDLRGRFVEILKTQDSGQFSYFTAMPNITRGNHYHHSKSEKFLVIKGTACFKFFHLDTSETHELTVNGEKLEIVDSIPGWAHNITNIGQDELVVILWSNENFDHSNTDTFSYKV
jgi:UDP-2-acetamido-2,6-beta-L-arabino-hexul-4-ose reductase